MPHAEVFHRHDVLTLRREDDSKWPQKNKDGRQELEIRLGNEHISFEVWEFEDGTNYTWIADGPVQTAKIGSLVDVTESADPEGLRVFYYLVQDLKALIFSLISLHFKVRTVRPYFSSALTFIPPTDQTYLNYGWRENTWNYWIFL